MDNQIITLIGTFIVALTGTKAWDYYQKRLETKRQEKLGEQKETHLYRDDLGERVAVLEHKLDESHKERESLLVEIKELSEKLAAMTVKIEFLERENNELRTRLEGGEA